MAQLESATALSSGLPSAMGYTAKAGESSNALAALAECRRQREQQEQLLLKAQEELQKAAQLAKTATERRVGAPEPVVVCDTRPVRNTGRPSKNGPAPAVRPALRGALRRQKSDGEALKSEAPNGVSASLRAAAALSPHRGFYHGSSPPRRPSRAQTTSGRLAWADAPPLDDEVEPEVVPAAAGQQPTAEPLETEEPISTGDPGTPLEVAPADLSELTAKSSPSWKRLEKTVTEYVSRRNVTSSEYEQVRQRYEGHLNELKTLCETLGPVGRPAWSDRQAERRPKTEREKRGALNFRELHDEKALLQRSSCSPRQAPRKPGGGHSGHQRSPTSRKGSEKGTVEGPAEEVEEKSVVPPLLSARMLSAVPMARLHQDNDLEHVRSLFCAQVPEAQLLSIYRVENPTLEGVYSAVRDAMGSESCELDLWHGTSCECVPNIVLNGFNRAYSGRRHGTKLGHGSYFSASAAYSTRFCDRKRHRRTVFFAKVLVGEWAKGSPELVEPPCKDAEGLLRYDCTVDDTESPVNFCIFRDFQAMPTYLLEFTTELRGRDQRTMTTRAS